MLTDSAIATLRTDLVAAGYTLDAVAERLGTAALAGLARNSGIPAAQVLGEGSGDVRTDPQADLIRLWLLGQSVPDSRVRAALAGVDDLVAAGLLEDVGAGLRATVEIKPHGSDRRQGWICSDPTSLDGRVPQPRPDFVLGASPASTTLTQLVPPRRYHRVLDLGTGCGIQAIHLDADEIVATDLNPRALDLARITLGLSEVPAELRLGSLYEPVAGESFDLIVTNPPYVMSPPDEARLVYREGAFTGDELVRRVVTDGAAHLAEGGVLIVLANWAVTATEPWEDRLARWIRPTGCDAIVLQRELLDPFEYVELWLTDAGLAGTSEYSQRYLAWLDYFAAAGIEAVGMGWIALSKSGRAESDLRFEEWPHTVHQPVGQAFAEHFSAIAGSRLPDGEFLATHWRAHPGLVQETIGAPGAAEPQHLVLRQQYGFGRAIEAGTAVAALVGACDGDLPLDRLIGAVASLLEVDPQLLGDEVLPQLRSLVAEGYLLAG